MKKTGNEIVVQVKKNQKKLLESCEQATHNHSLVDSYTNRNNGHGRKEKRIVEVFNARKMFEKKTRDAWPEIQAIIKVKRVVRRFDTRSKKWKKSIEESLHVSTALLSAREFSYAIREHWWIENKNHYVRDVSMHEDCSRIRINPDRMVILRSFGLNLMRVNNVKNVKLELFENGLKLEKLLTYEKLLEQ